MNENNKISIIVPIYNSQQTLEKCIKSLLSQTYSDIEIILIDDGSTDNSKKICEQYVKKDTRIKFLYKTNGGVSSARNKGIDEASGKYICFVDSDDWVEKEYCEILLNNLLKTDSQLSICNIIRTNESKTININNTIQVINRDEAYYSLIRNKKINGYLWNKLYLSEIIKKMGTEPLKEDIHMCEDLLFNSQYLEHCSRIVTTERCLYNYYINVHSITNNTSFNEKKYSVLLAWKQLMEIYHKNSPKNEDYIIFSYLKDRLNINYRIYCSKIKINYKGRDKRYFCKAIKSKVLPLKNKIYLIFSYIFPITTSKIKFIINKYR